MKKIIAILLIAVTLTLILPSCKKADDTVINIGVLAGPTGMGMAKLITDEGINEKYEFVVRSNPTDAIAELSNGDVDMLCMPTNTAATLAATKPDYISVLAINCLGSLYIIFFVAVLKAYKYVVRFFFSCFFKPFNTNFLDFFSKSAVIFGYVLRR